MVLPRATRASVTSKRGGASRTGRGPRPGRRRERSRIGGPASGRAPRSRAALYRDRVTNAKTPLELAALATVAVPGLRVAGLRAPQFIDEVVSVTGIIDTKGDRWLVTSPHETVGGLDLTLQTTVLSRLAKAHDHRRLPFDVPRIAGHARTSDGSRVMVCKDLGGRFMEESDFVDSRLLPSSLGRAIAALHNLPDLVYTGVDLPAYSAAECRERHLALLDEAARETLIPANLWNRWEAALEDVALWRFRTAPVHGDLQVNSVTVDRECVLALSGFTSAHVGDPAVDIAWVLAQASDDFLDRFRAAYTTERDATDLHVFTRAQLVSELALIRWLLHGVHAEDREIVEQARTMLADLAADLGDEQLVKPRPVVTAPLSTGHASEPTTADPEEVETSPTSVAHATPSAGTPGAPADEGETAGHRTERAQAPTEDDDISGSGTTSASPEGETEVLDLNTHGFWRS